MQILSKKRTVKISFIYSDEYMNNFRELDKGHIDSCEVQDRGIPKVAIPRDVFGWYYYDLITIEVQSKADRITLHSQWLDISPFTFYGAAVIDKEDIHHPDDLLLAKVQRILLDDECTHVVRTRHGEIEEYDKNHIFVDILKDA